MTSGGGGGVGVVVVVWGWGVGGVAAIVSRANFTCNLFL